MSIMSTNVVHRRGNTNYLASKNDFNDKANENGGDYDKRSKPMKLKPVMLSGLVALMFILGIMFLRPEDESAVTTLRSPSASVNVPQEEQRQAQARVEQSIGIHGGTGAVHQVIFSTGCSTFQDWQSYIFFFHAFKAGQPGHVTRIASGCSPEEAEDLKRLHKQRIEIMSDRFHLHLTPEFSKVKPGVKFKYMNKPYGGKNISAFLRLLQCFSISTYRPLMCISSPLARAWAGLSQHH